MGECLEDAMAARGRSDHRLPDDEVLSQGRGEPREVAELRLEFGWNWELPPLGGVPLDGVKNRLIRQERIGFAAPVEDRGRLGGDTPGEFLDEPALADAGLAGHEHKLRLTRGRGRETPPERCEE